MCCLESPLADCSKHEAPFTHSPTTYRHHNIGGSAVPPLLNLLEVRNFVHLVPDGEMPYLETEGKARRAFFVCSAATAH